MGYYYRQGGTWQKGTPRQKTDGQFQTASTGSTTLKSASGDFGWNQTFTDTSWLQEADQNGNLNVDIDHSRKDEFGQLSGQFARLRDALKDQIRSSEQARRRPKWPEPRPKNSRRTSVTRPRSTRK
jgi:flagellar basal body rod protein FlgB